jgi:predicted  nucleic acid-binding Zn-ribbon protein
MQEIYQSLLAIQALDHEIAEAEKKVSSFDPELAVVDAPATALARETETARTRLAEIRDSERRLERGAAEKRDLLQRSQERLERVRTAREETAAHTEIDLIRGAVEADETEALELMDQALRAEAGDELAVLQDRRGNLALRVSPASVQLYDRIRAGKTRVAITGLTADGACGCCFGVVPLQRQTEIQQGATLIRCEECGVILHPGS